MYHNPIMKLTALLLLSAIPAAAQTAPAAKPPLHHPASAAPTCAKLPELSPKIPALPASLPCAKALYTITTVPSVRLDYVSPLEGPAFAETLGIEPSHFTLAYVDTKIGAGELAAPHKFYSLHYTGYLIDGTKFDSSLDRGEPLTIEYGKHQVIPGWDTGFAGMRVGGKRRLFIPYQLAYGPNGKPPTIPGKSELIFDVELVSVADTKPEPKTPPTPPIHPRPATPAPPSGTPPAATQPPAQPGSAQSVVGQPTTTPPATPAADPTKPTATPPKP
jgi:peptidylprolyl isomerase